MNLILVSLICEFIFLTIALICQHIISESPNYCHLRSQVLHEIEYRINLCSGKEKDQMRAIYKKDFQRSAFWCRIPTWVASLDKQEKSSFRILLFNLAICRSTIWVSIFWIIASFIMLLIY
jgi:hypothetical protein